MHVSQLLSTTKVKLVDKMVQITYLRAILHVKHKKHQFWLFLISGAGFTK